MVSTPTTRNGLEKQGTGDNEHTWGEELNDVIDRIDESLDGWTEFTLSGDKTLTSTDYDENEARMRVLHITGGTGGTITVPSRQKNWAVRNWSTGPVTFTTGAGDSATVPTQTVTSVLCNGTHCYVDNGAVVASAIDAANQATAAAATAAEAAADALAAAAAVDPNNLVHISGAETIAGLKTFAAGLAINGQTLSGLTAIGKSIAEAANEAAVRSLISLPLATTSDVRAGEGSGVVTAGQIDAASQIVNLSDQSTIPVNWNSFVSGAITLGGNRTLGNPTNVAPGTSRLIFVEAGSGTRTLTFGDHYVGSLPTLNDVTTTKKYVLMLIARASDEIIVLSGIAS